jgi:TrmH family RNA methyltransferase
VTRGPSRDDAIALAPQLFDDLAETRTSQGIIGLFARPQYSLRAMCETDRTVVALDGVQDPGNVGTIVRLAAAFDAAGVALLPGCADAFAPKAVRSSAGAILRVPVVEISISDLMRSGLPLYAADGGGESRASLVRRSIIVFGSEGSGVSPEIREAAKLVAIRISKRVESLNVAAAAAIVLHQLFTNSK